VEVRHFLFCLAFPASDCKNAFLDLNIYIVLGQASSRDDNAVFIFTVLLDVVRRIGIVGLAAERGFEKIVKTVKAYGLTEQWCQRKCSSHDKSPEFSPSD
jgi:hypothetical protein